MKKEDKINQEILEELRLIRKALEELKSPIPPITVYPYNPWPYYPDYQDTCHTYPTSLPYITVWG